MSTKKHTVAIMGLGVRGKTHLKGIMENSDRYEVVGLCDLREDVMKAVSEQWKLDVPLYTDVEKCWLRQNRRFLYSLLIRISVSL